MKRFLCYTCSMQVVQVQSRWKLHEHGFPWAIRYDKWDMDVHAVEEWLRSNYGAEHPYVSDARWRSHWPKSRWVPVREHGGVKVNKRPYFIGLKSEADATLVILATTGL